MRCVYMVSFQNKVTYDYSCNGITITHHMIISPTHYYYNTNDIDRIKKDQ